MKFLLMAADTMDSWIWFLIVVAGLFAVCGGILLWRNHAGQEKMHGYLEEEVKERPQPWQFRPKKLGDPLADEEELDDTPTSTDPPRDVGADEFKRMYRQEEHLRDKNDDKA